MYYKLIHHMVLLYFQEPGIYCEVSNYMVLLYT